MGRLGSTYPYSPNKLIGLVLVADARYACCDTAVSKLGVKIEVSGRSISAGGFQPALQTASLAHLRFHVTPSRPNLGRLISIRCQNLGSVSDVELPGLNEAHLAQDITMNP